MTTEFYERLKAAEVQGLRGAAQADRVAWPILLAIGVTMTALSAAALAVSFLGGTRMPHGSAVCAVAGVAVAVASRRPDWSSAKACLVALATTSVTVLAETFMDGMPTDGTARVATSAIFFVATGSAVWMGSRMEAMLRSGLVRGTGYVDDVIRAELGTAFRGGD